MSMIAIPISEDIGRMFNSVDMDGKRDPSDHITMFYLGDDYPVAKISKLIPLIYEVTKDCIPFEVKSNRLISFPKNDDKLYPYIAEIKSEPLQKLHSQLKKIFDKNNIKYSKKYPDYKPHLTLGYSKRKPKNIKFEPVIWNVNNIALYGGDTGKERLFITFPFNLGIKTSSDYICSVSSLYLERTFEI